MDRIPVAGPWITEKEVAYVADAAAHAWYGDANIYHQRFESAFAKYLGVKHAMALPSCTSAIHLSLLALGIGPGDEVIVPDITWIASAAPVTYVGASAVFADIDPATWCLSVQSFERCITPRTKAVIPVDLYGGTPDWDGLRAVADAHHVVIIEDAAQAVGAEYHARRAGSFGTIGVFSFHGSKTLTTGEGGLLVTNDSALYDRAAFLRDHGRAPGPKQFWNAAVAYKYKMSSLQAALGLAQLERIDELMARKREAFEWYRKDLENLDGVCLNSQPDDTVNAYWMVTLILNPHHGLTKEAVIALLAERRIDSRPFFYPLSSLPAYQDLDEAKVARHRNATAYAISPLGINLPSALALTREDVRTVCEALRSLLPRGSTADRAQRALGVISP